MHLHSNHSDGSHSPSDIIDLAWDLGLKACSLTDHDTVSGIGEAMTRAAERGIPFIPGVELSAEHGGELHILGYFRKDSYIEINSTLEFMKKSRDVRNQRVIKKLKRAGIDITMDDVSEGTVSRAMGKPHMAKVLLKKGYAASTGEAFEKYLNRGTIGYVPREKLSWEKCIEDILACKGVPVLAHPVSLNMNRIALDSFVKKLKENGLIGLEAYYSLNDKKFTEISLALCKKYDLIPTGGSDFHGTGKPDIFMGKGRGTLHVPFKAYERLSLQLNI